MARKETKGPIEGYDFEEKKRYREKIWGCFARKLNPKTAVVMFMPSKEGLEIPIALSLGFKEENLVAVDDCPAVIAASKWRKEYPKIRFYGNDIARAGERMREEGVGLDAANLDLCSNLNKKVIDQVFGFIHSGCLYGDALIALTMMRGREQTSVNLLADLYIEAKKFGNFMDFEKRLRIVFSFIEEKLKEQVVFREVLSGEYKSRRVTMAYGVVRFIHLKYLKDTVGAMLVKNGIDEKINIHNKLCIEQKEFRDAVRSLTRPGDESFTDKNDQRLFDKMARERRLLFTERHKNGVRFTDRIYSSVITKIREDIKRFKENIYSEYGYGDGVYFCLRKFLWDYWNHETHDFWSGYKLDWGGNYYYPEGRPDSDKADKDLVDYLNFINWKIDR